jgi:hypothetical protein
VQAAERAPNLPNADLREGRLEVYGISPVNGRDVLTEEE